MAVFLRKMGLKLVLALVVAYLGGALYANWMGADVSLVATDPGAELEPIAGRSIAVATWNIGYAGLGAESDFVADGGESLRPPSRKIVDKNLDGVADELGRIKADVILMQETAKAGFLTRGADVLGAVDRALAGRDNAFSADISTYLLPRPMRLKHGLFTSAGVAGAAREIVRLPHEPTRLMGVWRRRYHMQTVRVPFDGGGWTLIDIHLSAFDEGANVRLEQLRAVLKFAEAEYAAGRHVVIGGDWNYEFARPARPSTTGEEFLFWVHPFPYDELGAGWRAVVDEKIPSVRTNERPYRKGENFTTVIDGFVVSPNVAAESVAAVDLDFQFTDHQPVVARFNALTE